MDRKAGTSSLSQVPVEPAGRNLRQKISDAERHDQEGQKGHSSPSMMNRGITQEGPKATDNKKKAAMAMTKILGMSKELSNEANSDNVNLEDMVEGAQKGSNDEKRRQRGSSCALFKG